jgi:hypothetical protein
MKRLAGEMMMRTALELNGWPSFRRSVSRHLATEAGSSARKRGRPTVLTAEQEEEDVAAVLQHS